MRLAAVPLPSKPFRWERNTTRASRHVAHCSALGAELVLLPELFSVGYCYEPELTKFAEQRDGRSAQWLRSVSQTYQVHVGGTFIERDEERVFNTFMLVSPHGEAHFYRKRFLPLLERPFFHKGCDNGIFDTPLGRIGVLICWDITSRAAVRELAGNIDLLLICSAWPDAANGSLPMPVLGSKLTRAAKQRPAEIARELGVPALVCNMGGEFATSVPFTAATYRAPYVESTAMFDARGRCLSKLPSSEDYVFATAESEEPAALIVDVALPTATPCLIG